LLADAGADVIKVEPPEGDSLRDHSDGVLFEFLNTSKRSIVLDLGFGQDHGNDDDRATLLALYATADLVIESFEPGVIESLDLGLDASRVATRAQRCCRSRTSGAVVHGPIDPRPNSRCWPSGFDRDARTSRAAVLQRRRSYR
jgi:crotonobetainyl-CoA:carnitine CoA-transferase CaiB-like acyl-CoA transferase